MSDWKGHVWRKTPSRGKKCLVPLSNLFTCFFFYLVNMLQPSQSLTFYTSIILCQFYGDVKILFCCNGFLDVVGVALGVTQVVPLTELRAVRGFPSPLRLSCFASTPADFAPDFAIIFSLVNLQVNSFLKACR